MPLSVVPTALLDGGWNEFTARTDNGLHRKLHCLTPLSPRLPRGFVRLLAAGQGVRPTSLGERNAV